MAEDIRKSVSDPRDDVSGRVKSEVTVEALRQSESCLYMSTQIYIWLRRVRWQNKAIILAPIIFSAVAAFSYAKDWLPAWGLAVIAFLSTLIPSIADALDIQTHVEELKRLAAEWKALQDRFRQLAKITALGSSEQAEAKLGELMDRLDAVRAGSVTPPEKYYQAARRKIKSGDYDFTIDVELRKAIHDGLVTPMGQAS
jgi:hypothetical protein